MAELPRGFEVYQTAHYMKVFYDTSRDYARWCGAMFETTAYLAFRHRLEESGRRIGRARDLRRLTAIIFSDKARRMSNTRKNNWATPSFTNSIIGYYDLDSNRMVMYDLSVGAAASRPGRTIRGPYISSQFLADPNAAAAVSTLVHEATHQDRFPTAGFHQRLSDCPRWFSEGIAMYCETPDLGRTNGWAGIGRVNPVRRENFWSYFQQRPADSLKTLIGSDARLLNSKDVNFAYAESWALTYYLIHKHPKQYIEYLKVLSRKQPIVRDDPATRIAEFEKQFGPPGQARRRLRELHEDVCAVKCRVRPDRAAVRPTLNVAFRSAARESSRPPYKLSRSEMSDVRHPGGQVPLYLANGLVDFPGLLGRRERLVLGHPLIDPFLG